MRQKIYFTKKESDNWRPQIFNHHPSGNSHSIWKHLVFTCLMLLSFTSKGQQLTHDMNFIINSPAAISGEINYGYADNWGPTSYATFSGDLEWGISASDSLGCDSIVNDLTGKIAVVRRGACTFSLKAYHAQQKGAIACVIISNQPGAATNMAAGDSASAVNIPCILISQSDGNQIATQMGSSTVNTTFYVPFLHGGETAFSQKTPNHQIANLSNINVGYYNSGSNPISNVTFSAKITSPQGSSTTFTETLSQIPGNQSGTVFFSSSYLPSINGIYTTEFTNSYQPNDTIVLTFEITDHWFTKDDGDFSLGLSGGPNDATFAAADQFGVTYQYAAGAVYHMQTATIADSVVGAFSLVNAPLFLGEDFDLILYQAPANGFDGSEPDYSTFTIVGTATHTLTAADTLPGAIISEKILDPNTGNPLKFVSQNEHMIMVNYHGDGSITTAPRFAYSANREFIDLGGTVYLDRLYMGGWSDRRCPSTRLMIDRCDTTHFSMSAVACDSYVSPSGNHTWTNTGNYTDTLVNAAGCDSILFIDLTVNYSNTGTEVIVACDSYTWIDGNTYTTSNNTATYTLTNMHGCDSVVTLNLTVNYSNSATFVHTACDSYTWIDGVTYTSDNSTATHTLINSAGCDSVVTLNLTVNYSNSGTDVQTACDAFTWIDGLTYTTSNNIATHTLTNVDGCDSVVTLNLTMNYSNSGTDSQTACDSYTWIDGNTYTTSNNSATHTLTNLDGCDSIVTLDLTIHYSNTGTDQIVACDSYTWIDGNTYTASNNVATHTLTNINGCDSIVTLDLTIHSSNLGSDVHVVCDSMTWIDGNLYTESNNSATHTLTNINGCDSVVTLDLTVYNSYLETDVQTVCDSFVWIDGNTYYENNNTVFVAYSTIHGCDSIISLDLTVNSVSDLTTSTTDGVTLTANNGDATYQWLDCADDYSQISGATDQVFTPTSNGNYAIELTENGCVDTSECVSVTNVGIAELSSGYHLTVYPNPNNGEFTIKLSQPMTQIQLKLYAINGQLITSEYVDFADTIEFQSKPVNGLYLLEITSKEMERAIVKVKIE